MADQAEEKNNLHTKQAGKRASDFGARQARPPAYAELQATTNFSFLRGGSHPEELVATAKALGLAALAVTDRNTLAGVVRAHAAAKEVGLALIVGARLDLAPAPGETTPPPSLLCLPTSRAAYGRLSRLLTLGQRRAEKGKCEITLADAAAHAEGQILIALPPEDMTVGCVSAQRVTHHTAPKTGAVPCGEMVRYASLTHPTVAQPPTLAASLRRMRAALPAATPLYLAASHHYRGDDRARIAALARLAQACATPLVATGDALYHAPHRRPLQDVLTCIREKCTLPEAGFSLAANAERHLKGPIEMARLFAGHEAALARTLEIARACRFSLDELAYDYPDEPVPPGETPQSHLEALTWAGAERHYPQGIPDQVRATLDKELALIAELAYAPYFLTVHDIVAFARSQSILCQGRGSAANSAVCFCLGITNVNPVEVDLLFERFISPERKEPPDIDVDFEHERREEVIQYIYRRYGRERAGLAATVITYRARSAVREVGKAMGLSEDTTSALAGMVWGTSSGDALPEGHVREAGLDASDPLLARTLELATELIGFPRHLSQHVGGFVLTRSPLSEIVPIGNAAMEERTCIEWDKDDLDALGLLKVDVLGLGMLTCIRRAFDLIARHKGEALTLASIPREDVAVYDMLCRADSIGVFQVESRAQMNMLPRLRPRTFYDLVIEVAIVRPGPIQGDMVHPYLRRRSGLEPEDYPSPDPAHGPPDELRQILGKTKGVPLFQEQAMRIAMVAARFSPEEANQLRRAMATFRRRGTIHLLEEKMVGRMTARGYAREFAERCFDQIKGFGEYGFPESHAASFAHLVYVSAWLKCHHPEVFAAALLNSQPMGFYAPAQIVRDAREHGVEVRAVDVSMSDWDCTLEPGRSRKEGREARSERSNADRRPQSLSLLTSLTSQQQGAWALRLGLRQVSGLKQEEAERIVAARMRKEGREVRSERRGARSESGEASCRPQPISLLTSLPSLLDPPFRDIHDLWLRAGVQPATLAALASADAFRSLGLDRRQALWEVKAIGGSKPLPLFAWSEAREAGTEPTAKLPEMALSEHVVADYQTLRLSLKAHPVSFLRERLAAARVLACKDLQGVKDGQRVAVAGVVLVRQRPGSANGVVFMTIEDETGIANAVIWSRTLERFRKVVMGARLVLIRGRVQRHEDIIHVVAERLEDRSGLLDLLSPEAAAMPVPIANADEVQRPEPGSARGGNGEARVHPRFASRRHPREERIIPKSRDFH